MKIISTRDVFADNEIYLASKFSDSSEVSRPRMPAKSLVASLPSDGQDFEKALRRCHEKLCELMPSDAQLKLFCAQDMFFDNSAVVRSKGLWKSNTLLQDVSKTAKEIGPERIKSLDNKIRHYALCSIELREAFCALETIRRLKSCFGLFDDSLEVKNLATEDAYYDIAFPKMNTSWVDWSVLIQRLAKGKSQLVRVIGTHDDREVSVDIFNW